MPQVLPNICNEVIIWEINNTVNFLNFTDGAIKEIPMNVPSFETNRLMLRGVEINDAPSYQKNFANFDIIQYLSFRVPWPYPENGAELFIKDMVLPNQGLTRWTWGIFLKENPQEIIGVVELFHPGIPENRGFWLAKSFWGKGLMTEATKPVMDFAFTTLGLESVILSNAVQNNRARRIKEKAGASFMKTRPARFANPKVTLTEDWLLTKEMWIKNSQKNN